MSSLGARRPILERQIALRRELMRRQAREKHTGAGGLFEFVKYFWPVLEPKTKFVDGWAIRAICEHLEAVTFGDITRILINVPPGFSKALDDDTPVMTTWGWKRHGDIVVGDFVFGPDGRPKRVEAVSDARVETGYEVLFDDGASIVASADHLWAVERDVPSVKPRYTRGRKPMVVTTKELVATGWVKESAPKVNWRPDRIPMCEPIKMPPKRLLVDPYVLGAWLGDGATLSGVLYAAEQDIEHFKTYGEIACVTEPTGGRKQRFYRIRMDGVQERLRIMGVLGNKHIPDDYLEASEDQRWELLRGLMDTDGCATAQGYCTYTTKLHDLGEQIVRLCSSLGIKARIGQQYSAINGETFGPYSVINFTAPHNACLFKLKRKQDRISPPQNGRSRHRYVQSVTDVGTRTLRCIQVEGGIYLAGHRLVPTHNSLLVNTFWPAWEWGPMGLAHHRFVAFSYAAHLTQRDNGKFRDLVQSRQYTELYSDRFESTAIGVVKVANNKTGWKFASSVGGVGTGERGDRVLLDDPHNVADGESDVIRTKTVRWYDETMSNRLNDMQKSAIVVIMQRVHQADVSGFILDHEDYVHLMIAMEYDGRSCKTVTGWEDPRTEIGELAWPERYPINVITRFKSRSHLWAGQYQQMPKPRGGGIFKEDWWVRELVPIGKAPPVCEYVVASLDSAYTKNERNDPSGFTAWGVYRDRHGNPKVLMLAAWRKFLEMHGPHMDRLPMEADRSYVDRAKKSWGLTEWVAYECKRLKVDRLLIEAKASGISIAQEMQRLYKSEQFGVELVDPEGDKYFRAMAVVHLWTDEIVAVPCSLEDPDDPKSDLIPRDWADLVIDEMSYFPNGKFRDLTDSTTQAMKHLRSIGLAVRREEREDERIARSMHQEQLPPLYPI